MRCLFTMFAEDVGLLEDRAFTRLLEDCRRKPVSFVPKITELWNKMNTGGYSVVLDAQIRRFNGGLFADTTAVALNEDQVQLLLEAANADWKEVEPAIFGTLLERALDPRERHKLGAHYTPRAYVERLVQPTIMEPLRREWDGVQAAALKLTNEGKNDAAVVTIERFLQRLADLRVLDPACGSANFLYVTLELLKRLEGEVRNVLRGLGQGQISIGLTGATITPENMLGIELNPRAAKIAELVLWIGYLQWHLRSTGDLADLGDPVLRDYHNIENRDAVLAWDHAEDVLDDDGNPVTRWDGVTYKTHPVTGEQVPDDLARTRVQRLVGAKATTWPRADFIVGNPPFIGDKRMNDTLGKEYVTALRKVYSKLPNSIDFVMYWWFKSGLEVHSGNSVQFGLITTNSIKQTFNRRVIEEFLNHKKPLSLKFAIPDHPWVDSQDGAAVRIAMSVVSKGEEEGVLNKIGTDNILFAQIGKIYSDLTIGANIAGTITLAANINVASIGVVLIGKGFFVDETFPQSEIVKEFIGGRDITQNNRNLRVIDAFGLEIQQLLSEYPREYQWLRDKVKPIRDQNNRKVRRDNWWIFGEPNPSLRDRVIGLEKIIVTPRTAKHRFFTLLNSSTVPESEVICITLDDNYFLGVLSSKIHTLFADLAGGRMGIGNDSRYMHSRTFETFPFPTPTEPQKIHIRNLAERLDAHRKRQQTQHEKLTMTGMYNVLEQVRAGEPLTDKEKNIYDHGLVGILRELHDELDAAVALAYGWPADLEEQEILQRLVDLNAVRAAEEARGLVRWLRPEYQAPDEVRGVQSALELDDDAPAPVVVEARKWPATLAARATALRELLAVAGERDLSLAAVATAFKPKLTKTKLAEAEGLLDTLVALGQAEVGDGGWHLV
ncbi:class I SAM-dependent DNA methyltransferase [Neolewinella antarctica]|uniref:site-specific DNA-methyltransferase (adenine-specific) n=1 Tax=Neolewinella antarctica TaxID=442734 RepID=A0ABX0XFH8_9BACT|nr:class I SAM-dependent DNA methyltransferase [Neolewinella antarctica]NJC28076.1 hypothetical protein [Neolewinella antarctica]